MAEPPPGRNGILDSWPVLVAGWCSTGLLLAAVPVYLVAASDRFDWSRPVADIPAATLTLVLVGAGLVYMTLPLLVRASLGMPARRRKLVLALVLAAGALMRIALLAGEPALEDDSYRFLWEGALTAHGISPYRVSPLEARVAPAASPLGRFAAEAGPVLDRVNHPWLGSTYPPVAQAVFAVSHLISPWDLRVWRLVCLFFDAATLALLLALLAEARRPLLWSVLYWWNPLVIKEIANSGHMDALPVALVLAALWLGARRRHLAAVSVLALAAGAKLWPAALLPLIVRPLVSERVRLALALGLMAALCALWAMPLWQAAHSGLAAYARGWSTNSALTPLIESVFKLIVPASAAALSTRLAMAAGIACLTLWLARRPLEGSEDLFRRAGYTIAAVLLLAPAQFPWYAVWLVPFLAFTPHAGLMVVTVAVPLYYLSFHYAARDAYHLYTGLIVRLEWVVVWALLGMELFRSRARGAMGTKPCA